MANGMPDPRMPSGLHDTHPILSCYISRESGDEMMGVKMHGRAAVDHGSVFHGMLTIDQACEGQDSFEKERGRLEFQMNI